MKSTSKAKAAYEAPEFKVIKFENRDLICTSTEGYGVNPNGFDEGDFE